ncbi:MAG: DUF2750 domain-containing protein [Bacteroidota bacterium]
MLQDIAIIDSKYKLFIERVAASKLVWGLKNKKGWANSESNDNEEIAIIPFWSDRAYAKACAKDDWKDYSATEIPLADFLEGWCIEMADEAIWVGVNWDTNMFGKEIDASTLALDVLNQLKLIQSAIKFSDYNSIEQFIAEIQETID